MDVRYLKNSLFETQTEKAIFPISLFLKLKKKISFTLRFRKPFCTFLLFWVYFNDKNDDDNKDN